MGGVWEKAKLHLGLVLVQTLFAGYQILSRVALIDGVSFVIFSFYRNIIALAVLLPSALMLERNRPPLTLKLLLQFFLLGIFGLLGAQSMFLMGVALTSAALGAAFQNAVPVFTFVLAAAMGLEKILLRRKDGIAKLVGTVLCMLGAMTMSLYKGPVLVGNLGFGLESSHELLEQMQLPLYGLGFKAVSDWQLGATLLLGSSVLWACYLTLQTSVQKSYPAPFTILAFTYFFGALQFGGVGAVFQRDISYWVLSWGPGLLGIVYAGVIASGVNFSLQAWCLKEGGPLLTAAFIPLQCVIATIPAVLLLGDSLYVGSIAGGVTIVIGLYLVIWGRAMALHLEALGVHEPLINGGDSET